MEQGTGPPAREPRRGRMRVLITGMGGELGTRVAAIMDAGSLVSDAATEAIPTGFLLSRIH